MGGDLMRYMLMPYRPANPWLVSADERAESLHVRVMLLPRPRLDSDSIVDCQTCANSAILCAIPRTYDEALQK